jgi:hypothetical protein
MVDQFHTWLVGGPAPATTLKDNLQSVAMLFGAIQASETNQVVDVPALLRDGRRQWGDSRLATAGT